MSPRALPTRGLGSAKNMLWIFCDLNVNCAALHTPTIVLAVRI